MRVQRPALGSLQGQTSSAHSYWLLGASVLARGVQNGEFETCPVWVLGMDMGWRFGPIVLKTMRVPRFDHGAIWVAKVRNVSRGGGQKKSPLRILQLRRPRI